MTEIAVALSFAALLAWDVARRRLAVNREYATVQDVAEQLVTLKNVDAEHRQATDQRALDQQEAIATLEREFKAFREARQLEEQRPATMTGGIPGRPRSKGINLAGGQ